MAIPGNDEFGELRDLMASVGISDEGSGVDGDDEVAGVDGDEGSGETTRVSPERQSRKNLISEIISHFTLALEHDRSGDSREGLKYYKKGLECLLPIMKDGSVSDANKQKLKTKFEQYIKRAESLQKKIRSDESTKAEEQGGTAGTAEGAVGKNVDPKLLDYFNLERPALKLSDVGGLGNVKDRVKECIILPLKFPLLFKGLRSPSRGILLYGLPGVGKTMLMKAVAGELEGVTYMRISAYDLMSRYSGIDPEKSLRQMFTYAKEHAPSLLILDDYEGIFPDSDEEAGNRERRIKTEFMVQFESVRDCGIIVVGVTLAPWRICAAIRKRFSMRIEVPLPNEEDRIEIFKQQFKDLKDPTPDLVDEDFVVFASKTDGYTGADISVIVREASIGPVRVLQAATHFKKTLIEEEAKDSDMVNIVEKFVACSPDDPDGVEMGVFDVPEQQLHVYPITKEDVLKVIETSKASVDIDDLRKISDFTEQFA